jgi:hypothetical protein
MAHASSYTRIPLDNAAKILGIDPLHFNSVVTEFRPELNACDDLWFQYAPQREGQASREDLALALRMAEDQTFIHLGYPLVPIWVVDEEQKVPVTYDVSLVNRNYNSQGFSKSIRVDRGYALEGGVKAKSVIEENSAVVYSDNDGDGYDETATVVVPTTLTDGQEVHLYYPGESGSDYWEIRPITVSISANTATITFKKELAVLPDLIEKYASPSDPVLTVDGDDNNNFLEVADVYRVYNDPSDHGLIYAESTCDAGVETATIQITVRNGPLGVFSFRLAEWDSTNESWETGCSSVINPYRLLLKYRAGKVNHEMPRPYFDLEPQWERAIVYYAATLLDRAVSGCENTHNIWALYTEDLALSENGRSYSVAFADLANPLGTSRAALNLWKMIKRHRKAIR